MNAKKADPREAQRPRSYMHMLKKESIHSQTRKPAHLDITEARTCQVPSLSDSVSRVGHPARASSASRRACPIV
jgi:hypothetical protein